MTDRLMLRGKIWWCWYYDNEGRMIRASTKCTDRSAAMLVLRRLEREAQGDTTVKRAYVSLGDVLTALETWVSQHSSPENAEFVKTKCKPLRRHLGAHTDVHTLTRKDLTKYTEDRVEDKVRGKHISRPTVKKELATLYQGIARTNRQGLTRVNIDVLRTDFEAPYVPKKRWLSREDFDKLWLRLPEARRRWLMVAVYTGARKSEVESLRYEDIEDGLIHIRGTKTQKSDRYVPLHPVLKELLGEGSGSLVAPWGMVGRDLKVACKAAKITPVSPNDLRRTYASWLLQAGVTNSVVAELLGHTTTALVDMTYGKLSRKALTEAVALI